MFSPECTRLLLSSDLEKIEILLFNLLYRKLHFRFKPKSHRPRASVSPNPSNLEQLSGKKHFFLETCGFHGSADCSLGLCEWSESVSRSHRFLYIFLYRKYREIKILITVQLKITRQHFLLLCTWTVKVNTLHCFLQQVLLLLHEDISVL